MFVNYFPLDIGVVDIKRNCWAQVYVIFHYEFIIFISVYLYSFFIYILF